MKQPISQKQRSADGEAPAGRRRRIVIPFRAVFKWLVRLRRSPRAVAGGFAVGTFIAFTPTFGVQIFLAIFLATLINVNRPAAVVAVWITNVATLVPIYTFNYWIGSLIWPGPPVAEVYRTFGTMAANLLKLDIWDFLEQFEIMRSLSTAIVAPLFIGSFIAGSIAALLTYIVSLKILGTLLKKRREKRVL